MEAARNWTLHMPGWISGTLGDVNVLLPITICRRFDEKIKSIVSISHLYHSPLPPDWWRPPCMQVSLLLATRQTHLASAGVRGALFGWSVVKSRDTDARYYVFVAIRQNLMIMSKVLLRVEIDANYNVWWTYHPKQWHSSCSASAERALQVKICPHEAYLAARAALYLLVWVHNFCRMWVTEY